MVSRVRDQVESFIAYGGYHEGMTVGEILGGSRADRLVNKELEKTTCGLINDLVDGRSSNKLVKLPDIDWKTEKYHITKGAAEIANQIEQSLNVMM